MPKYITPFLLYLFKIYFEVKKTPFKQVFYSLIIQLKLFKIGSDNATTTHFYFKRLQVTFFDLLDLDSNRYQLFCG